jgi:pyruvate formate lyase activating enzyme
MGLQETLDEMTRRSELAEEQENDSIRCLACAHRCLLKPGQRGICQVRRNLAGELQTPWGYVSSLQVDPIEKKPFYHFLAGKKALTFGMLGCNLKCGYCQNWLTSQALKEHGTDHLAAYLRRLSPREIISYGTGTGADVVASSYNEPLISSEWARDIFLEAKESGLRSVFVSNGFATPEVLDFLLPALDGFKVDLKTMQKTHYRELGARLQPVLESIQYAVSLGLWVEIVTLLVPGFNDSIAELNEMAAFIGSISADIPWHISAFRPEYKMSDRSRTASTQIHQAIEIGYENGLHYVYGGNLPGYQGDHENTRCHHCGTLLIARGGYLLREYRITEQGACPDCNTLIPGVWG